MRIQILMLGFKGLILKHETIMSLLNKFKIYFSSLAVAKWKSPGDEVVTGFFFFCVKKEPKLFARFTERHCMLTLFYWRINKSTTEVLKLVEPLLAE